MAERPSLWTRAGARGGLLAVALLLAAALMVSALMAYRDAEQGAAAITQRQAFGIERRLRRELGMRGATDRELAAALEAHEALGLRYVGLLVDGRVVAQAGHPWKPDVFPRPGDLLWINDNDRVRVMTGPPRSFGPRHTAPPQMVLEVEPMGAPLKDRALFGFWLALGTGAVLTSAALLLARQARRGQRIEAELGRQQHLASLGEMSAVLAHEIRNPLASLKGHAQLLAERLDATLQPRAQRVVDEAVRLEALTNDLLAFARSGVIERTPVSPAALLEDAAATTPERIERVAEGAPATFSLDGARMRQVLVNLLENALAVTPDGEKVVIAASARGANLEITVRDRGPGIPHAERARIFEPFHTTKTRGTGLGLAVAKRIVDQHRGRIEIEDAPGGGALFRVVLPPPAQA